MLIGPLTYPIPINPTYQKGIILVQFHPFYMWTSNLIVLVCLPNLLVVLVVHFTNFVGEIIDELNQSIRDD